MNYIVLLHSWFAYVECKVFKENLLDILGEKVGP